jgi:hypothetical protein
MLGEVIGKATGQITGMKVLSVAPQDLKIEVSFQGSGTIFGENMTEVGTYTQNLLPGGQLGGKGKIIFMTEGGGVAMWEGGGIGSPTGAPPASRFAVYGVLQTQQENVPYFRSTVIVSEYETAADGTYSYTTWEWK